MTLTTLLNAETIKYRYLELCYPENNDIQLFMKTLITKKVPFDDGSETTCISYEERYEQDIEKAAIETFGKPPPGGLSLSWGERNPDLKSILTKNEIDFETQIHHGKEYISWRLEDSEKVETLLDFEPWKKEMMRKFRENNEQ